LVLFNKLVASFIHPRQEQKSRNHFQFNVLARQYKKQ
jgi:hypothetical protein